MITNNKAFTLVEILVAVVMISILSSLSYFSVNYFSTEIKNMMVESNLDEIVKSLNEYKKYNNNSYPAPDYLFSEKNMNILCFDKDLDFTDDCNNSLFIQGLVDRNLLKDTIIDIPKDPRTKTLYTYSVTSDRKHYMIAGVQEIDNKYIAITRGDLKGFIYPSIIRAYDDYNFVLNGEKYLPYSMDENNLTGTIRNISQNGNITCNVTTPCLEGTIVKKGDTVKTDSNSTCDIYFSDGSITTLTNNSEIVIEETDLNVKENSFIIKLKLNSGKIWNKVAKLASKSEFNIETTGSIAGVRGTVFSAEITDNSNTKIQVLSGKVELNKLDSNGEIITNQNPITINDRQEYNSSSTDIQPNTINPDSLTNIQTELNSISTNNFNSNLIPYVTKVSKSNENYEIEIYLNSENDYSSQMKGLKVITKENFDFENYKAIDEDNVITIDSIPVLSNKRYTFKFPVINLDSLIPQDKGYNLFSFKIFGENVVTKNSILVSINKNEVSTDLSDILFVVPELKLGTQITGPKVITKNTRVEFSAINENLKEGVGYFDQWSVASYYKDYPKSNIEPTTNPTLGMNLVDESGVKTPINYGITNTEVYENFINPKTIFYADTPGYYNIYYSFGEKPKNEKLGDISNTQRDMSFYLVQVIDDPNTTIPNYISPIEQNCNDVGGYPDNGSCWIIGGPGESCDTACEGLNDVFTNIPEYYCAKDMTNTFNVDEGGWNVDDVTLCTNITGKTNLGNPYDKLYAPYMTDTACVPRKTEPNPSNLTDTKFEEVQECGATDVMKAFSRICKCI